MNAQAFPRRGRLNFLSSLVHARVVQASADGYKIELEARGRRITELEGTLPQAQERVCNLEASLAAQLKDVGARARVLDEREAAVVVREVPGKPRASRAPMTRVRARR